MTATRHFTFDLTGALAEQLDAALLGLDPAALTVEQLERVDATPGIYQLYLDGLLVYVGKADRSLLSRLTGHYRKLAGRLNIDVNAITFTGLHLEGTWIPVGPEQMLIKRREQQGIRPPWNYNGFGINDPGKERDTTNFRQDHFDVLYPADLNYRTQTISRGIISVSSVLRALKSELPYVFRFQNQYARHPDYLQASVEITQKNPTSSQIFETLIAALPPGWQITALPGYVIMYKNVRKYPGARQTYVSKFK